ncbi:MAG: hypothetical protein JW751_13010 [Polyangiaceae bacterium]|nr:hypothetical protein [Polyangiaceae bacterium]
MDAAHAKLLLVFGTSSLPFGGSSCDDADHHLGRPTDDHRLRDPGHSDAEDAGADPQNPRPLRAACVGGSGRHLGISRAGAMADAIDLARCELGE